LHHLPQHDLGFGDFHDSAKILPQVITYLHLVQQVIDAQQGHQDAAFCRLPTIAIESSGMASRASLRRAISGAMIAILPGEAESRLSARVSFWTLKGSIASAPWYSWAKLLGLGNRRHPRPALGPLIGHPGADLTHPNHSPPAAKPPARAGEISRDWLICPLASPLVGDFIAIQIMECGRGVHDHRAVAPA
jgi:hypothetical protein